MKIKHTFKQIDASDAVRIHAEDRLQKLVPHLTKQHKVHFIFKKVRGHEYQVDVTLSGHNKVFQASSKSNEDFYVSIDSAIPKLVRQLAKKKDRLQNHKHAQHSRQGKLDRMNESMEHDFSKIDGVAGDRSAA